jgi:uncharacterized protein
MRKLLPIVLVLFACNVFGESKEIAELRKKAEAGDAEAQNNLGYAYDKGEGVPQDYVEAFKWFRKAAEQRDTTALHNLGYAYAHGVHKDLKEAIKLYRLAAAQGHAGAYNNLGDAYEHGVGVKKDYKEAIKWYRLGADRGGSDAQTNLGFAYIKGELFERNPQEAFKWFRKAAEQGNANAQLNLGVLYDEGKGAPKDSFSAYVWFSLSSINGLAQGAKERDALAKKMTPEQIAKAQELAKELQLRHLANKLNQLEADQKVFEAHQKAFTGDAEAQAKLCVLYATGNGVPKNDVAAKAWMKLAFFHGYRTLVARGVRDESAGWEADFARASRTLWNIPELYKAQELALELYDKFKTKKSEAKKLAELRKRAMAGDANASTSLGAIYQGDAAKPPGKGVTWGILTNDNEAIKWHLRSIQQGGPVYQGFSYHFLSLIYKRGNGVPKDLEKSSKLLRKSAELGLAESQCELGRDYLDGKTDWDILSQDYKEAVKWLRKAALQGHAEALRELGGCYFQGKGVLQDYVSAYALLSLAGYYGHERSSKDLPHVAKEMTPEQIAKAQEMSKALLKKIEANKAAKE